MKYFKIKQYTISVDPHDSTDVVSKQVISLNSEDLKESETTDEEFLKLNDYWYFHGPVICKDRNNYIRWLMGDLREIVMEEETKGPNPKNKKYYTEDEAYDNSEFDFQYDVMVYSFEITEISEEEADRINNIVNDYNQLLEDEKDN